MLGTALEKLTGKDTYDALDSELAKPVGMQDFDRAKQKKILLPCPFIPNTPCLFRHATWRA